MSELDTNNLDRLTSVAKGIAGVCPLVGPLASEAIGLFIPKQRLDRVVEFLKSLEFEVQQIDSRLERLKQNLNMSEGLDIFEEGLFQATRAVSKERQGRLARLIGRSLTAEELKYAESKKLLNLFRELTDPEILWLYFYATNPTLDSEFHRQLMTDNPDVLIPVSRESGAPQEQRDRAALQDSYINTLFRLGLIREHNRSYVITNLGRLLVRYIVSRNESDTVCKEK